MLAERRGAAESCRPRYHRVAPGRDGRRVVRAVAMLLAAVVVLRAPQTLADTIGVFAELIHELIGQDGEDAQELARATVAATRSNKFVPEDEQPVALGGAIGTIPQTVDRFRPLRLEWHGGRPPFRVQVAALSGGEPVRDVTSDARAAVLDVKDVPPGTYRLTIGAADKNRLSLQLTLAEPADIPASPHAADAATDEQKALLEAVWLLMRGKVKWHLEALSQLQALAEVRGNSVAKLILAPPS